MATFIILKCENCGKELPIFFGPIVKDLEDAASGLSPETVANKDLFELAWRRKSDDKTSADLEALESHARQCDGKVVCIGIGYAD
jgi:hypothetical protein